jgi:glycosyl hydrolase family 59 (putative galactocerebrosidase)
VRRCAALSVALPLLCGVADVARAENITFEQDVVGIAPSDFDSWGTGDTGPGQWAVVSDDSARGGHALEQYRNEPTAERVPLAIYKPFAAANLEVVLRFKAISGSLDRSAGIAVRLTTPDDYYMVRASALTHDVRLYRILHGTWDELASAPASVTSRQWHTLALKAEGDRFFAALDGQPLLTATDATFRGPGRIALCTKADSVTRFDHLDIKPLP